MIKQVLIKSKESNFFSIKMNAGIMNKQIGTFLAV